MSARVTGWTRRQRWIWTIGLGLYLAASVAAITFVPDQLVPSSSDLQTVDRLTAVAAARQTILLMTGGGLAVFTLILTIGRDAIARGRADRESDEHVTSMYMEAVRQLGDRESMPTRIGGIYALKRIAADSTRDHEAIVTVLAAFLREHGQRKPGATDDPILAPDLSAAAEVLAALTAIKPADRRLDLEYVNFFRQRLHKANFSNDNLMGMRGANAQLDGATLVETILFTAELKTASLRGVDLTKAGLDTADLTAADLEGATLTGANIANARLHLANLDGVKGLTNEQVEQALGWNKHTKWPKGFVPPTPERDPDNFRASCSLSDLPWVNYEDESPADPVQPKTSS